jgi:hypothetical protein
MSGEEDTPKIHIDSDWKEEAQQEKDRLAAEEKSTDGASGAQQLGQPTFLHLLNSLAMQAAVALGGMRGPQGEAIPPDPELARFHIDLLGLLEEKTKGNLDDEEQKTLSAVLHDLRGAFVQLMHAMAGQQGDKE